MQWHTIPYIDIHHKWVAASRLLAFAFGHGLDLNEHHMHHAHHHHHHMNHMQYIISSYKFLARLLFPHYAPDLRVNHMCRHNLVHPVKVIATVWDTVLVLCLTSNTKNWYLKCGEVAAPRWFRIKTNHILLIFVLIWKAWAELRRVRRLWQDDRVMRRASQPWTSLWTIVHHDNVMISWYHDIMITCII